MSRTYRRDRYHHKRVREGTVRYKCKCSWCVNIKWRDRMKEKEDI